MAVPMQKPECRRRWLFLISWPLNEGESWIQSWVLERNVRNDSSPQILPSCAFWRVDRPQGPLIWNLAIPRTAALLWPQLSPFLRLRCHVYLREGLLFPQKYFLSPTGQTPVLFWVFFIPCSLGFSFCFVVPQVSLACKGIVRSGFFICNCREAFYTLGRAAQNTVLVQPHW